MIPKVIHYCWFGKKRKPKLIRDCIESWKKHCPDYEIIEWNEKNTDLSHPFVKQAYKLKKWAFVADYIRFKTLYEQGGIYLDTDMMLLKSLDNVLKDECFFGAEESEIISCGIIGATKGTDFIKECMHLYDFLKIDEQLNLVKIVITALVTALFRTKFNYYDLFDKKVAVSTIVIYPSNFFYSFPFHSREDIENYRTYIDKDSYAVHLWSSSWIIQNEFKLLREGKYYEGFKIVGNTVFSGKGSLKYLRKVVSCVNQSLSGNE